MATIASMASCSACGTALVPEANFSAGRTQEASERPTAAVALAGELNWREGLAAATQALQALQTKAGGRAVS